MSSRCKKFMVGIQCFPYIVLVNFFVQISVFGFILSDEYICTCIFFVNVLSLYACDITGKAPVLPLLGAELLEILMKPTKVRTGYKLFVEIWNKLSK